MGFVFEDLELNVEWKIIIGKNSSGNNLDRSRRNGKISKIQSIAKKNAKMIAKMNAKKAYTQRLTKIIIYCSSRLRAEKRYSSMISI
jgi:hypothetical protein